MLPSPQVIRRSSQAAKAGPVLPGPVPLHLWRISPCRPTRIPTLRLAFPDPDLEQGSCDGQWEWSSMSAARQPNAHRQLRSVAQEAQRLGVSKGWLYTEARAGRFPHVRLGSRILLDPSQVDAFLARRSVSVEQALEHAEEGGRRW